MSGAKKYEPPTPSVKDLAHTTVRAAVSAVPYVGSPALEFFNTVIVPPIVKRQQQWMEEVAEGLRKLEASGAIKMEDLQGNEAFVTAVMQASQVAQRTHQREKIDALRNAVLNTALHGAPDDSLQQIFLGLVDRFTEWHLRLLALFADPPAWYKKQNRKFPDYQFTSSLDQLVTDAFPELKQRRQLYDQIAKDLYDSGLMNTSGLHVMMSGSGAAVSRTTEMGLQLLKFITAPPIGDAK
jgi:hypothetical protein